MNRMDFRLPGGVKRDPAIDAWLKTGKAHWDPSRGNGFTSCERVATTFGNSCTTAVRSHV